MAAATAEERVEVIIIEPPPSAHASERRIIRFQRHTRLDQCIRIKVHKPLVNEQFECSAGRQCILARAEVGA